MSRKLLLPDVILEQNLNVDKLDRFFGGNVKIDIHGPVVIGSTRRVEIHQNVMVNFINRGESLQTPLEVLRANKVYRQVCGMNKIRPRMLNHNASQLSKK